MYGNGFGGGMPAFGFGGARQQLAFGRGYQAGPLPGGGMAAPNFGGPPHLSPVPVPGTPGGAPGGGGGMADALRGILGGTADRVGGFLGGNDGQNGLMAAALAMQLYGSHKDRKEYDRQTSRREGLEDEERERYDSWAPERQKSVDRFRSRLGG